MESPARLTLKMASSAEGCLLIELHMCRHPLLLWGRRLCWDGRSTCDSTCGSLETHGLSCAVTHVVTRLIGLLTACTSAWGSQMSMLHWSPRM